MWIQCWDPMWLLRKPWSRSQHIPLSGGLPCRKRASHQLVVRDSSMACCEILCERQHSSCRSPTIKDVQWVQEPLLPLLPLLWSNCWARGSPAPRADSEGSRSQRGHAPTASSDSFGQWGHLLQVIMSDSDGCITEGTRDRTKPEIIFVCRGCGGLHTNFFVALADGSLSPWLNCNATGVVRT